MIIIIILKYKIFEKSMEIKIKDQSEERATSQKLNESTSNLLFSQKDP
jgi:hypothetical protein